MRDQFSILARRIEKGYERGFSPAEVEAINLVASGGSLNVALRSLGKFGRGAVGVPVGGGIGYAIASLFGLGPAGAVALPAIAAGSNRLATNQTMRQAGLLDRLARSGGQ